MRLKRLFALFIDRSVESEHIGTKKTLDMVLMANVWRSSTKRMSSVTNYAAGWRVIDAE